MHRSVALLLALAACNAPPLDGGSGDAGAPPATGDLGGPTGDVGPNGGTVDRLYFAFHGDTRPPNCDQTSAYPTAIIQSIYQREAARGVELAVDLGDHMFVCDQSATEAQAQMDLYLSATKLLPKTTFMTMGNHECESSYCAPSSNDANYKTFMAALAPVAQQPFYSVDVQTRSGLATFVFVADSAWSTAQQSWLEDTLTKADANAKYTIVLRHHPLDNTQLQNSVSRQIIQAHKYTLFLTGHTHEYRHDTYIDKSGRTLRMGAGGAPLQPGGTTFYGYGTVEQQPDDRLAVTVYDQADDSIQDAFTVDPQ